MRVAQFWARAEAKEGRHGRSAWASSDTSLAEAQLRAEEKANALLTQVIESGDSIVHQYMYQQREMPEPIVQEMHDNDGKRIAAVTINRYGAQVLNTASLAFVDVDFGSIQAKPHGGLIGRLFSRKSPAADPIEQPLERLRAWARQNPKNGARVYRTAAGLRYLLTHPGLQPDGGDTHRLMEQLGADPLYALLCRSQGSFRARLSPKPWRIGVSGTPKLSYEKLEDPSEEARAWMRTYEDACRGYAVCSLIDEIGQTRPPDDNTARLIALHDERAGVGKDQPLA